MRTPENRGEGLLDRPGKKVGHKTGGSGEKGRIRIDLPESAENRSDGRQKVLKNRKKIAKKFQVTTKLSGGVRRN